MDKKALEKYLRPSYTVLVVGIIIDVFCVLFLASGLFLPALITLILGCVCTWAGWSSFSDLKKQLDELEASGRLDSVLREFGSGKQFFKDKLRLGPTYILGKRSGKILTHSQVRKVYQYVHKTNFAEDLREMRVETDDGKVTDVCKIPLKGKGDQELVQAIAIMKTMNPGIHIGYK